MISQSDRPQSDFPTIEPAVEPIPPRYWWLKRIGVVAGILLVALFALRLWWGWEANRRLQATIDKIIAAGEPIYPEDFDPKEDIPNEQNAARLLIGADEAINLSSEQQEVLKKVTGEPDKIRARLDEVRGIVESNSEVFRRLRRARGLPGTDWGMRFRTPVTTVINNSFSLYSGQRQLSRLMDVSAQYHHGTGNDAEAVEILRDALAHSENLSQQQTLISQLVAWACEGLAIQAIEDTLPSLIITPKNDDPTQGGGSASHAQVRSLLVGLMDERGMREGMRRAMMCERMSQVDIIKQLTLGKTSMSGILGLRGGAAFSFNDVMWRYPLFPAVTLDGVAVLRETTRRAQAPDAMTFPEMQAGLPRWEEASGFCAFFHPLQSILSTTLDRSSVHFFRALTMRRLAGTALAIRLYEVDHGRRPETLAELVPEYLPAVPQDPFAEAGRAIVYLPSAAHPIVYSVGENGVDDWGDPKRQNTVTKGYWQPDTVFFLDGRREDEE